MRRITLQKHLKKKRMIWKMLRRFHEFITSIGLVIEITPLMWVLFPFWSLSMDVQKNPSRWRLHSFNIHLLFVTIKVYTKWTKYRETK